MQKTTTGIGAQVSNGWHINKPYFKRPKVTKHARLIDGLLVYVGIGKDNTGKQYLKELFDRTFLVIKGEVRPRTKREERGK